MNRQSLESPFTPAQIKHRKGNFNRTLAYVEAPAVISRLNDAFDTESQRRRRHGLQAGV